ncbi:MAG: hypothetical protein GDA46_03225 [Bdellovibrionales bacterium]|nr:hypothetical protein [Bdellovibrionales bacterium]
MLNNKLMLDLHETNFQKLSQLLKEEYDKKAVFNPKQNRGLDFSELFGFWNEKVKSIIWGIASLERKSAKFIFLIRR